MIVTDEPFDDGKVVWYGRPELTPVDGPRPEPMMLKNEPCAIPLTTTKLALLTTFPGVMVGAAERAHAQKTAVVAEDNFRNIGATSGKYKTFGGQRGASSAGLTDTWRPCARRW